MRDGNASVVLYMPCFSPTVVIPVCLSKLTELVGCSIKMVLVVHSKFTRHQFISVDSRISFHINLGLFGSAKTNKTLQIIKEQANKKLGRFGSLSYQLGGLLVVDNRIDVPISLLETANGLLLIKLNAFISLLISWLV